MTPIITEACDEYATHRINLRRICSLLFEGLIFTGHILNRTELLESGDPEVMGVAVEFFVKLFSIGILSISSVIDAILVLKI